MTTSHHQVSCQVDTDGDGLIDYKEFRDMMLQGNEYVNRVNSVIQSM